MKIEIKIYFQKNGIIMYHFKEYEHNPLIKRDTGRNNISYVDYPKSTMLFHLVPIQSSPHFTEPSPNSNPMFVAYHRILCQAKREKKSSDICAVRMIHPHKTPYSLDDFLEKRICYL